MVFLGFYGGAFMPSLGEILKHLRINKNITQKDIANYMDMTVNAYQKYEYGVREPDITGLTKLADYYNVSLDYLTNRKNILFYYPEGNIKYDSYKDSLGSLSKGEFHYSFGSFTSNQLYVKFLYLEDIEGTICKRILEEPYIFFLLANIIKDNFQIELELGLDIVSQKNYLRNIDFVIKINSFPKNPYLFHYKKISSHYKNGLLTEEIIYENFVREYLSWPIQKKIDFLAKQSLEY